MAHPPEPAHQPSSHHLSHCLCCQGCLLGWCHHRGMFTLPAGRLHGTATTAPGNMLLIKARGWAGGERMDRGVAARPRSVGARGQLLLEEKCSDDYFGALMPAGTSLRKAKPGTGVLHCKGIAELAKVLIFRDTAWGQCSEEDQAQSPETCR